MLNQIRGLHHITSIASSARNNNRFFTGPLGLRRIKKTVNFDAPDIYHLYYADEIGTPGTVLTYFPFPDAARGASGSGEVATTAFSVPRGSLPAWSARLADAGLLGLEHDESFGQPRLRLQGPDGEGLALVEADDARRPWTSVLGAEMAIRGFHSVTLRVADAAPTADLLRFMGYEEVASAGRTRRFGIGTGNGADLVDVEESPDTPPARQGAGSVHHVAFAVESRARQSEVRTALTDEGWRVTPQIDRDYFWAIYFRSPGGILFEVATDEPGFDRDEDRAHLGEALKLPSQHAHLRPHLERHLEPID